jgi:ABC-type antimicrobial peptide transport system permease subunit
LLTRQVTNNLLAGFAAAALLLAVVGIYGVMAMNVSRRIHEFGIRLALGASRADVFRLVLRQSIAIMAAGVMLGLGAALWVSRYVESLLYGVEPRDPLVLMLVISLLSAVGLAASFVPAVRATATSPLEALRGR